MRKSRFNLDWYNCQITNGKQKQLSAYLVAKQRLCQWNIGIKSANSLTMTRNYRIVEVSSLFIKQMTYKLAPNLHLYSIILSIFDNITFFSKTSENLN